jgi:ribosomal protein S18 acetylase RimI-like enzyme
MNLEFIDVEEINYQTFHDLLLEYYRDAEDADTEQGVIDDFINRLYDRIVHNNIKGKIVSLDQEYIGFVVWMIDQKNRDFSEIPGYGVILEIGLKKNYRKQGFGQKIVQFAEKKMISEGIDGLYIEAYGPAVSFWTKCGYENSGKTASNELPIFMKQL